MTRNEVLEAVDALERCDGSIDEVQRKTLAAKVRVAFMATEQAWEEQDALLQDFRQALPEHECGPGWEQAVLTAIDTRREVLAAVDKHVQGWHPGRSPAEVVAHLTDEIALLRDVERGAQAVASEALAEQRKAEKERDAALAERDAAKAEVEHWVGHYRAAESGWQNSRRLNAEIARERDDLKAAKEKAETYRKQCEADWNACCDVLTWARAFGKDLPPPSRAVAAVCERVLELELTPDADPYVSRVTEFHRAMGLPVRVVPSVGTVEERVLRVRLLLEEALEYATASAVRVELAGFRIKGTGELTISENVGATPDLVAMTHELGDCQVIVSGCAVQLGLPLLAAVSEEIHPANMRKLGPDGRPVVRGDGKVVKPEGWKPANVARIVERVLAADEVTS